MLSIKCKNKLSTIFESKKIVILLVANQLVMNCIIDVLYRITQ